MSNRRNAPAAAPEAAPAVEAEAVVQSGPQIETRFEIVDNTAAEAPPEREAEASERQRRELLGEV